MDNYNPAKMLEFSERGDERGNLVVVEGAIDVPFEIKRIFYIYGSDKDVIRGKHANRESEFVLVNVAGTSKIKVMDGKGNEKVYALTRPRTGIYLPKWSGRKCMIFPRIPCSFALQARITTAANTSASMMNSFGSLTEKPGKNHGIN